MRTRPGRLRSKHRRRHSLRHSLRHSRRPKIDTLTRRPETRSGNMALIDAHQTGRTEFWFVKVAFELPELAVARSGLRDTPSQFTGDSAAGANSEFHERCDHAHQSGDSGAPGICK